MESTSEDVLSRWRARLADARADAEWLKNQSETAASRKAAIGDIASFVSAFIAGGVSADELRSTFDQKTRSGSEWTAFGFGGPSAGMFLNMLLKYVPEREELIRQLKAVLRLPPNETAGFQQMEEFRNYLEALLSSGAVTRSQVQVKRMAFLISAFWHCEGGDEWPPLYSSAWAALLSEGLVEETPDPVKKYFRFREAFGALARDLGITAWELEGLCFRLQGQQQPPATSPPPPPDPDATPRSRVWLVSPGPNASEWDRFHDEGIIAIGWSKLGDLSKFQDLESIKESMRQSRQDDTEPTQDALACWEFAREMQIGDEIFVKKGRAKIVGYGRIDSDYRFDATRSAYPNVRLVKWLQRGEWTPGNRPLAMKTVTDIGRYPELVRQIHEAVGVDPEAEKPQDPPPRYTIESALNDLFLDRDWIEEALALLRSKKNLVLQGPPGVGKTFVAERLARLVTGSDEREQISWVQFHQSYSYEDFVQGYRAFGAGFKKVDGPFFRLCNLALQNNGVPYVMVIDEINRGNLSRILGELMMLIECDKRDERWSVSLTYGAEDEADFYVPPNVYLIGTMNTADRSLALVDYALRRRFAFLDVEPSFDSETFETHLVGRRVDRPLVARIRDRLRALNNDIVSDPNLGRGFSIGHSYFCAGPADGEPAEMWHERIVRYEIEPLLREYWPDSREKVEAAVDALLTET
jgi:MoxR-like ATPase